MSDLFYESIKEFRNKIRYLFIRCCGDDTQCNTHVIRWHISHHDLKLIFELAGLFNVYL